MRKLFASTIFVALSLACDTAFAGAMSANNFGIPSKDVALHCSPANYSIHCSISLRANPEYSSYCFYVADGRSYPMKTDYRFGFYNNIVNLHLSNGSRVTADLKDLRTGAHARCFETGY
ncbi:hypothetical protein [Methylocystis sp. B8]|uniref:hypothetical protein n=1 Tax=Methylocystis sp. B8 TaxID=544938 RepID=UPI0010FEB58C|nr:hypothetical protein [Methylocystis sp. B8]TLG75062.1 hypothetical protein FEV16_11075 [Methylocystis sp. B8]